MTATVGVDDLDSKKENFYCHILTDYLVPTMRETYIIYKLGLGIFSMQGMERSNKESKNCTKRFYNNRYNICISTLLRLYDLLFYSINVDKKMKKYQKISLKNLHFKLIDKTFS